MIPSARLQNCLPRRVTCTRKSWRIAMELYKRCACLHMPFRRGKTKTLVVMSEAGRHVPTFKTVMPRQQLGERDEPCNCHKLLRETLIGSACGWRRLGSHQYREKFSVPRYPANLATFKSQKEMGQLAATYSLRHSGVWVVHDCDRVDDAKCSRNASITVLKYGAASAKSSAQAQADGWRKAGWGLVSWQNHITEPPEDRAKRNCEQETDCGVPLVYTSGHRKSDPEQLFPGP